MSWFEPEASIYLLSGVQINSDYNNTIYFPDEISQQNYFGSKVKYTLSKQSYQRVERGYIKVGLPYKNVYDCNYLFFRNGDNVLDSKYSPKWYYAFIDSVEYENDKMSIIRYTIDVIQTWWFDFTFHEVMIEREHVDSDSIGEHIIPEPVQGGNFVVKNMYNMQFKDYTAGNTGDNDYAIVVYYTDASLSGTMGGGLYTPCKRGGILVHGDGTPADVIRLEYIINTAVQNNYVIVQILAVPAYLFTYDEQGYINGFSNNQSFTKTIAQSRGFKYQNKAPATDEYVPKNNKLYTSQYNYLSVSDNVDNVNKYSWELSYYSTYYGMCQIVFAIGATVTPNAELICYPMAYRGLVEDYESAIPYSGIIYLPWTEDSFSRWWSQNKTSFAISTLANVGIMAAGIATGNALMVAGATGAEAAHLEGLTHRRAAYQSPLGYQSAKARQEANMARSEVQQAYGQERVISSSLNSVTNALSTMANSINLTDKFSGSVTGNNLLRWKNRVGFTFYDIGVCAEEAEVIDKYFDMFGYKINKLKVPNVKGGGNLRSHWNYIKTVGCDIKMINDGIPNDDVNVLNKIFDNGITFWMNGNEVGDYSLDNRLH